MKRIALILLVIFYAAVSNAASGPSDEQLKSFCRDVNAALMNCSSAEERQTMFKSEAGKFEKNVDLYKITAAQVSMLFEYGGMALDNYLRAWLEPVFSSRSASESVFRFLKWKYMPENDGFMHGKKETEVFVSFLSAKDLHKVVNEYPDVAIDVFNAMATMKDANWHTEGFTEGVIRLMECKLPELAVIECVKVFNSIARVDTIEALHREKIRKLCRKHYDELSTTIESPRKIKICKEQIKYLDGPFACGTLVGSKAPELHLMRVMKQEGDSVVTMNVSSLDDFKGKVIMLDFWGTKCVPCLQSFPEIAEIQKHFDAKDVVVLGVTSLQGYFVDTPNKRTIQCRNNKEKEMSLFPDYMKAMGMTWTVGISEEDVMNTDYGALAIPHVVVIDKEGIVRHNAVNGDKEVKIRLIEELL